MVRTDPFRRAREIGTAVGTTVGLAYRAGRVPLDPDKVWVARVRLSARIAEYDATVRVPATRSAEDDVWVRAQIARRNAHVRRLAERAGLDPDTAVEAARTIGLGAAFAGRFRV
jgi:hypothetical protein